MPAVRYRFRILVDESFIRWLIQKDRTYFLKLTHIKKSSIDWRGEHNVMIEEDGRKIINDKIIQEHNLRAAFRGKEIPSKITQVLPDKTDQMVVFAIALATDKPFFTYLLTTTENLPRYLSSPHAQSVKCISIRTEEEALKIIDYLWGEFCFQRSSGRF